MNIELKENDIIFDNEVDIFEDNDELISYIKENDNLNKMFGIHNKDNHNEDYQVNYYGIYNYENNSFYLNCCVTIYCEFKELKEKYPDIWFNPIVLLPKSSVFVLTIILYFYKLFEHLPLFKNESIIQ